MTVGLVAVDSLPVAGFDRVLAPAQATLLHAAERIGRDTLAGRRVWNVNSTAHGGGVAEMLGPLLAYARGAGIDARWVVIAGDPAFFTITKRLHNRLHGMPGDGGPLGRASVRSTSGRLRPTATARRAGRARRHRDAPRPADGGPRFRACEPAARRSCGGATSAWTCRTSSRARPGGSSSRACSRPTPTCSRAQPSSGMSSTRRVARSSRRRSTASRPRTRDLLPARVERILVSGGSGWVVTS